MSTAPSPKPAPSGREPLPQLSPLGLAAVVFGACNLLGPPIVVSILRPGDELAILLLAIGLGIVLAQFGILPAWLVWGERPFWQRLAIHWALATGLSLACVMGLLIAASAEGHGPPPGDLLQFLATMFLCLPAVSLGIEAPLWLTRFIFGWRLCRSETVGDVPRPLAISDFLWGMAVISGGLAAIRGAAAISYAPDSGEVWIGAAMAVGFASLASLLVMLPLTWCILRLKDVGAGIGVIFAYTLSAGIAILAIIGAMGARFGNDPRPVVALFLFLGSMAASVTSALGLARGAGFRLHVGRRTDEFGQT